VTKVVYLPDPEYQELALAGVETLVSTRLDPGVDPVTEADRRGAILAIIRLGNKDEEMPGSAPMLGDNSGVIHASYQPMLPQMGGPAMGCMVPGGPGGMMPPSYVSGVTTPEWGMTSSGTPIGLVGPPHLPLGSPAGLRRHTMNNNTHMSLPKPTHHVTIDVKQQPGFHYPQPANHVSIREQTIEPTPFYSQPLSDRYQNIPSGPFPSGHSCNTCP
jgi:hypothetical protein